MILSAPAMSDERRITELHPLHRRQLDYQSDLPPSILECVYAGSEDQQRSGRMAQRLEQTRQRQISTAPVHPYSTTSEGSVACVFKSDSCQTGGFGDTSEQLTATCRRSSLVCGTTSKKAARTQNSCWRPAHI